jgi:hypothetical protein
VSTAGFIEALRLLRKKMLPTVMLAVGGMGVGATAVALKVSGEPSSPSAVAVMIMGPAVPPAVTVTDEIPDSILGTAELDTLPPLASQPTVVPATPLPCSSVTNARTGNARAVPISAAWLSPSGTLARVAAAPAVAVAVKVTGEPLAPATVARAV